MNVHAYSLVLLTCYFALMYRNRTDALHEISSSSSQFLCSPVHAFHNKTKSDLYTKWRHLRIKKFSKYRDYTCSQFHKHFILAAFSLISFAIKLQTKNVSTEKLHKTLLYKKATRKMVVKLTPRIFLSWTLLC